jgi:hypothetical protein
MAAKKKTIKKKTAKKPKKKKLTPKPRIRRKLLVLWSEKCRSSVDYTCIICGAKQARDGAVPDGDKLVKKVDAHHIVGKEIRNSFFRFNLINSSCLCSKCHKFGNNSAHRNAVFFIDFIQKNYPEKFEYLIKHNEVRIDLDNREVLAEIESKLKENLPLDLDTIRAIEKASETKRIDDEAKKAQKKTKKVEFDGSLFDDEDESSPSENYLDLD